MATGIKLPEDIKQRIKTLGQKIDRSPHWIMKCAIESYLVDQERYWKERDEDLQEWNDYRTTGEGIAHSEVKRWLQTVGTEVEEKCPK